MDISAIVSDVKIHVLKGKELSDDMKEIARRQGVDLSMANMEQTKKILGSLPSSVSDDIVNARNSNESTG